MMARAAVAEDFSHIEIQPMQALRGFNLNLATGIMILKVSHALTLLDAENRVMAIAGVIEKQPDVVSVWVLLAADAGRHMLAITRFLKWAMRENTRGYEIIETLVRADFAPGRRWAGMFGFECVERGISQDPDGNLEDLYRRAA